LEEQSYIIQLRFCLKNTSREYYLIGTMESLASRSSGEARPDWLVCQRSFLDKIRRRSSEFSRWSWMNVSRKIILSASFGSSFSL